MLGPLRRPLRRIRQAIVDERLRRLVRASFHRGGLPTAEDFDFNCFRERVRRFVESVQVSAREPKFLYSSSCRQPTLYASAYACMTLSLVGDLKVISEDRRQDWIDYFDEFQSERDGLFYDPAVMNDIYIDSDWWGARHLALHMISAYTDLRARPRHPLRFLRIYYDNEYMMRWLVQEDWNSSSIGDGDIDNKIMNVGCLLQYQRDYFSDDQAGKAVECLKTFLRSKINQSHGMWGGFDVNDAQQRSRMVQFAYHVFPIFIYDNEFDFDHGTICAHVMRTQNEFGGFGVSLNSSACEDIDSVDVLIRCSPFLQADLRREVDLALRKALTWIMMNQAADGGFVFRLFQPNIYGSRETSSRANVGEMLSTWFRTLCLAYLCRYLELKNGFVITTCPGCEIE